MAKSKKKASSRRTKEYKRRSLAAKKGWEARRLKAEILERRRIAAALKRNQKKKKTPPKKKRRKGTAPLPKPKRNKKLPPLTVPIDDRIVEMEREIARLKRLEAIWVLDVEDGMVKEDGTLARDISTIRTYGPLDRAQIRKTLDEAHERGHLEEEALWMAKYLDVPVKEVYAFWYSP